MTTSPGPQAAAQPRLTPPRLDFSSFFFFFLICIGKQIFFFVFFLLLLGDSVCHLQPSAVLTAGGSYFCLSHSVS